MQVVHAESIIVMVEVPGIRRFYREIGRILGREIEVPPTHVTLYTYGGLCGIGLPTQEDFERYVTREVPMNELKRISSARLADGRGKALVRTERGFSEQHERVLRVAAKSHLDQKRKDGEVPYITHPVHVSTILLHHGFSSDVVIAGLLHDVVEDQGYDLSQIGDEFGEPVAEIVAALSERKTDAQGNERPWEIRKREALEHMC